jgi:hypothetical protein
MNFATLVVRHHADVESQLKFGPFLLPISASLPHSADKRGKALLWWRRRESNFRVKFD